MSRKIGRRLSTRIAALSIASLTIIAGLNLSGCAADGSKKAEVRLTFLNTLAPGAFDKVIAEFEAQNPGITVASQSLPFNDLTQQLQARLSTKDDSIDLLFVDPPRLPSMVHSGFLKDMSGESEAIAAAVQPVAMDSAKYDGKVWAVPLFTSSSFLFYNKDLLDAAGQAYPSADPKERLTWEEVVDRATQAQKAGAAYGLSFDQIDRAFQLLPLFESNVAGTGLSDDGLTAEITNPGWISTAKWYGDLFKSGLSPRGVSATDSPAQFIAGQVAYFVGGAARMNSLNAAAQLHYGIAPHPMFAGGTAVTPTGSWNVGVSAFSKHSSEAVKFAMFMSVNATSANTISEATSFPPVNTVAFPQYLKRIEAGSSGRAAGFTNLFLYESENTAVARPQSIGYIEFETRIQAAFSDIRNGLDAAKTLQTTSDQLNAAFAKLK